MTIINPEEFENFHSKLGDSPELQETLDTLKECDWILEDATMLIASRAGEPVEMGDSLLENLVEKSRKHLCKPEVKAGWSDLKEVLDILKEILPPPAPLAVACLFKLSEIGLRNLCDSEAES
ncbi:hypothetical protein QT970_00385 [Microcoleus sp. herbarium8]|uniref:hypothetical protein n=1 Tax=Microcoleus sp. herbarium8 TaxID=3055436 RepID=UPI002FCFD1BC